MPAVSKLRTSAGSDQCHISAGCVPRLVEAFRESETLLAPNKVDPIWYQGGSSCRGSFDCSPSMTLCSYLINERIAKW